MQFRTYTIPAFAGLIFLLGGCAKDDVAGDTACEQPVIEAYFDELGVTTRACISGEIDDMESAPVLWMPSDELGVFTAGESNVKYGKSDLKSNQEVATFTTSATVSGTPEYAYYPYSASAGTDKSSLSGNIPKNQVINLVTGMIPGDYKVGEFMSGSASYAQFKFTHIFSPIRIVVDAAGTDMAGERLLGIDMTVTRGNAAVPVTGSFTFSLTPDSDDKYYTLGSTSNSVTFDWASSPALDSRLTGYATVFPEVKAGDTMAFTVRTSGHTATFTVTSAVDFAKNTIYTFPLVLADAKFSSMECPARTDIVKSGTFTVADYNVKGSTSTDITSRIVADKWDVVGFCEDGGKIEQKLSGYTYGSATETLGDLLGFATRNGAASFSNEYIDEYDEEYGSILGGGTNTEVSKGFRYYLVTLADGVQVDVYITYMNTYKDGSQEHLDCQHAQLKEVATYINSHQNKRPVIFGTPAKFWV